MNVSNIKLNNKTRKKKHIFQLKRLIMYIFFKLSQIKSFQPCKNQQKLKVKTLKDSPLSNMCFSMLTSHKMSDLNYTDLFIPSVSDSSAEEGVVCALSQNISDPHSRQLQLVHHTYRGLLMSDFVNSTDAKNNKCCSSILQLVVSV